jgi:twitching motility protein PilU
MSSNPSDTVSQLLRSMVAQRASDLFIAQGRPPSLRIHGQIVPLDHPPTSSEQMRELLATFLNDSQRHQLEQRGDLDVG